MQKRGKLKDDGSLPCPTCVTNFNHPYPTCVRPRHRGPLYPPGDNQTCRFLHIAYATVVPKLHCPHIGKSGGGACVKQVTGTQGHVHVARGTTAGSRAGKAGSFHPASRVGARLAIRVQKLVTYRIQAVIGVQTLRVLMTRRVCNALSTVAQLLPKWSPKS